LGEVFQEVKSIRPQLQGEFVRHVGLYYSCRNRDLYGREEQARFGLPVMGAYKALVENHLQVDFVFDETVTLDRLRQFPVIFLPDVAVMTDEEVALIQAYVRQGGHLIATYNTSRYSPVGEPLDQFRLADVFGVTFSKTLDCDTNYFRNLPDPFAAGIDRRYYVLNQGPVQLVERTAAQGVGDLHDSFCRRILPQQFFSHNVHPPYVRLTDAIYINEYGQGKCIYVPFGLDRSYADIHELPEHRQLIGNLVRCLAEPPWLEVDAPLNAEAVLTHSGPQLRLHLTMFHPLRQAVTLPTLNQPIRPSSRMEEPALYRARIRMQGPFRSVSKWRASSELAVDGQQIELTCEDVHEVITIDL
jgi:hypothetical protein